MAYSRIQLGTGGRGGVYGRMDINYDLLGGFLQALPISDLAPAQLPGEDSRQAMEQSLLHTCLPLSISGFHQLVSSWLLTVMPSFSTDPVKEQP